MHYSLICIHCGKAHIVYVPNDLEEIVCSISIYCHCGKKFLGKLEDITN
jgi:hypothetical protein